MKPATPRAHSMLMSELYGTGISYVTENPTGILFSSTAGKRVNYPSDTGPCGKDEPDFRRLIDALPAFLVLAMLTSTIAVKAKDINLPVNPCRRCEYRKSAIPALE